MASIMDFIKEKDFSNESDIESFPEGKTNLDLSKTDVEEKQVDFEGMKKTRYVLTIGEKKYWAGTQIMDGIKQASESGFSNVVITRKGQGMKTRYTVMPLPEPSQQGDL